MEDKLRTVISGGREIRWILTRKKVRNVNLRIKPDGLVYVSASARVPIKYIEEFIRSKAEFIFDSLDKFASHAELPDLPEPDTEYRDGDTICYFGYNYTLSILIAVRENAVTDGERLIVYAKSPERVGAVLKKFFLEGIKKLFEELNKRTCLMFIAKGYNVPSASLQIRKMSSRWGSCHISKKKIVMNSRLALYPRECSEYVFVHEYAHFIVPNHSRDFYAVLANVMPDYNKYRKMLKE
ncbi:MAG: M48 family metallopeptidase [Oscillospiraceae bacterium]|nr:M48 family metallopeptidase [Oscillospiraceae bacterium]